GIFPLCAHPRCLGPPPPPFGRATAPPRACTQSRTLAAWAHGRPSSPARQSHFNSFPTRHTTCSPAGSLWLGTTHVALAPPSPPPTTPAPPATPRFFRSLIVIPGVPAFLDTS